MDGTICISPQAFAPSELRVERRLLRDQRGDEIRIEIPNGGVLADQIPVGQRKDHLQDLARQALIGGQELGYARRISVMARRSSPFR